MRASNYTKVLVTGSSGFLGSSLVRSLSGLAGFDVTGVSRKHSDIYCENHISVSDINAHTDWKCLLQCTDVVVHTAARVHIMNDESLDPLSEYRAINVDGTLNLASQSAVAGVKRFIFISSIKVNGEQTPKGHPYMADAEPAPEDAYGISKLEAEQGLQQLASETGMEIVIIRPPLIYGPGVKGNFASMIKLVNKCVPLPLGSIHNQRSFVALENLVDLIITCIDHPAAANEVFLASDGYDLSTTELMQGVAKAMGKRSWLIPVPESLLILVATVLGQRSVAQRLLGSLQVDISKARAVLGWKPPISVEEGLRRCFEQQRK